MLGPTHRAWKVLNDLAGQVAAGAEVAPGVEVRANRENLVVGEVNRRHVERGLLAAWFDYHIWADVRPPLELLQVLTVSDTPHPVLSARSLAGTNNPLAL